MQENQSPAFGLVAITSFRWTYASENASPSINRVINPTPPPPCLGMELGGVGEGCDGGGGGALLAGIVTLTELDWEERPELSVAIAVKV